MLLGPSPHLPAARRWGVYALTHSDTHTYMRIATHADASANKMQMDENVSDRDIGGGVVQWSPMWQPDLDLVFDCPVIAGWQDIGEIYAN